MLPILKRPEVKKRIGTLKANKKSWEEIAKIIEEEFGEGVNMYTLRNAFDRSIQRNYIADAFNKEMQNKIKEYLKRIDEMIDLIINDTLTDYDEAKTSEDEKRKNIYREQILRQITEIRKHIELMMRKIGEWENKTTNINIIEQANSVMKILSVAYPNGIPKDVKKNIVYYMESNKDETE